MPMPWTYRQATREWQAFLSDARDAMDLTSDNATFTAVEGVLRAFRARLTVQEALDFAQVLPSVLRALFVADWKIAPPPLIRAGAQTGPARRRLCAPTTTRPPKPASPRPPLPCANRCSARIWTGCWHSCRPLRQSSGRCPGSIPRHWGPRSCEPPVPGIPWLPKAATQV